MNETSKKILVVLAALAALVILVLLLPQAIGAGFLNSATAQIALAASLPQDSPDRVSLLNQADASLRQAQSISQNPRLALARARYSLANDDASRAASTFASHSTLSTDAIAQFDWANAAWQLGQTQVAVEHWRSAGAEEYFTQQMRRAAEAHLWNDAENYARIAVAISPSNADAHYSLGDALAHQSMDDAQAMNEIGQAATLTHDPEFLSTIWSRQGEILAAQGKLSQALDSFQQARQFAPSDARPRTDYALNLVKLDPTRDSESIDLLQHVVGDSPWYTAAYIGLADLFEARGDPHKAEQWYQSGLQRNPNDSTILFALGKFYARQHRMDEAKMTLTLALKNETHGDDLQAIGRALAELP